MEKRLNWIPTQEEKLLVLIAIWQTKLLDPVLQALYGWIADECILTNSAIGAFVDARIAYHSVPTKANHIEKDKRKKAAVEAMRKFAREWIRNNSKMSDSQKQELGIAVPNYEHSLVPVPDMGPESEELISTRDPGMIKVRYLGPKPYGVDRVEISWLISDTVIDRPEQLRNNETFSRNPWQRRFAEEERAKRLYYSLRYLTKEGASRWSDVREVIIP